ncbi:MAG: hypothetical protein M3P93_06450 [Actinomycetota bacterium]|nr:hypothetical protein [Actinomycetota bacterium]
MAVLELRYVALPALEQHTVTLPLQVNVVPGDVAAGRVPNPVMRTELAFLQAQTAKRHASTRLSRRDTARALRDLQTARSVVIDALAAAPAELHSELRDEVDALARMEEEAQYGDLSRAAKVTSSDAARKSRQRGRRPS